jgi:thioredoxin reductase (NADPH)
MTDQSSSPKYDVAIIGAGVAGLYAAYCCRVSAGARCCIIESLDISGGQCTAFYPKKEVYGVPGYLGAKTEEFMSVLSEQCLSQGVDKFFGKGVSTIDRIDDGLFQIHTQDRSIIATYIIIATGAGSMSYSVPPGIAGLDKIESDFIQWYCADIEQYKDKNVIVAGGGDSAVDMAIMLSETANSVTIIHRRKDFTCETSKLDKLRFAKKMVNIILNHKITELKEANGTRNVTIISSDQKDVSEPIEINTDYIVFCYGFTSKRCTFFGLEEIGLQVENFLIKVDLDTMGTSIKNCYAAGDVITYSNKKSNIVSCFFEADRCVRAIKREMRCSNL